MKKIYATLLILTSIFFVDTHATVHTAYAQFSQVLGNKTISLTEKELLLRIMYPCLDISDALRNRIKRRFKEIFCKAKPACKDIDDISAIPFSLASKLAATKEAVSTQLNKDVLDAASAIAIIEQEIDSLSSEAKNL